MKPTLFTITLLITALGVFAQQKNNSVQGIVRSDDGAVPFANVLLYQLPDSTFVKGATADQQGHYTIAGIPNGNYFLTVTSVGYEKLRSARLTISATHPAIDMDLKISQQATQIKEVVVQAQRPLIRQEAGITTVDVKASTLNAGRSLAEVLKRVPGVTVDKDGQVSLKGKQGVMVMLDGKPLYMDAAQVGAMLKSIPADQVKEIEVLTSPSAKYDAAGNAGMINIKLEKGAYEGFNGSVRTAYGHGVYPKYNAGGDLSYKKKKLSLTGSYQYNFDKNLFRSSIDRQYQDSSFYTSSDNAEPKRTHNALLNGSYEVSKNGTLSWDGNITREDGKWLGTTDSRVYTSGETSSHFQTKDDSHGNMQAVNTGLGYTHKLDTAGAEVSAQVEYKTSSTHNQQIFTTTYFQGNGIPTGESFSYRSNIPVNLNQWSAKADLKLTLPLKIKMETGVKHNAIHTQSDIDNTLTGKNNFDYEETIEAAYVMFDRTFRKWKVNAGLRVEHTRSQGIQRSIDSTFTREYTNLFPNGSISYETSGNTAYTILYSRRIERPNYQDLNPFSYYGDPYTIWAGNPYLLPQYTHHTEFNLSKWQGVLIATLNYSYTSQPQSSVFILDKENLTTTNTNVNLHSSENYGIALSLNLPVTSWWAMSNYGYLYNTRVKGDVGYGGLNLTRATWMINATHTLTFPKGISGELSFMYESPHYWGTVLYGSVWELSAGVQKKFMQERMSVKLSWSDIFWKHVYIGKGVFGNTTTTDSFKWDNRVLLVSLNYRFGRRVSLSDDSKNREATQGGRRR
jgi:iron complex outermembrane recepter protein